jgi:hypothetical protein
MSRCSFLISFPYFSRRISVAFRYDEGWLRQIIAAFGAALTNLLTKVTISASNYNASKEVLEKFKHSSENEPKKRYSRNFLLAYEGRHLSPSLGLGFSSILGRVQIAAHVTI